MGIVEEAHNLRILGSGNRTIVLAHGFGTDQSVWRHLVPHLVDDYRVVLFDNIGAGSTNPDYFDFERYSTLEGYAYDLLAILEELQISSCVFVGHSVSAVVGAIASILRPDLFSKLVLISASPGLFILGSWMVTAEPCVAALLLSSIRPNEDDLSAWIISRAINRRNILWLEKDLGIRPFFRILETRYLNDADYFGGFEQEELDQLFNAMQANFKAWVSGFAPLAVGGDMESVAVQEFSRTLFNIRPDIALSVARTIFQSDVRPILCRVTVPCHILQSTKDLAVPVAVSEYLHTHLGSDSIVEVMPSDGHLPQLSCPEIVIPVLLRHIRHDIAT